MSLRTRFKTSFNHNDFYHPFLLGQVPVGCRPARNVSFVRADIRDLDLAGYDFISCIAAIHHLPFGPTVAALRDALAPGGVLAIVGLSRPTLVDLFISAIAFGPNKLRQLQSCLRDPG